MARNAALVLDAIAAAIRAILIRRSQASIAHATARPPRATLCLSCLSLSFLSFSLFTFNFGDLLVLSI